MKKIVLAYSGGLDTSFCLAYFKSKGHQVHTVLVNTGGFNSSELKSIEERAYEIGSDYHEVLDETSNYYEKCIKYMVFGNVLKNNTYPLSVSSERIFQGMAIAQYANQIGADAIAHGSTGAGNDQVRFDMCFKVICPGIEIITPIRTMSLSRQEEIEFLKNAGVQDDWEQKQYSVNKGLWGTSIGGKETLTSRYALPESVYTPKSNSTDKEIGLTFQKGELVAIDHEKANPIQLIQQLNAIGLEYGIGRDIHVGDTIVGIKGRVAFEASAALMIIKAHEALEKHVLSKWQIQHKSQLSDWYGMLLHEGQYLEPFMRDVEAFLDNSQNRVSGTVYLQLKAEHFSVNGIESPFDLMQAKFGTYGEENNAWTADQAMGFIELLSVPLKNYYQLEKTELI